MSEAIIIGPFTVPIQYSDLTTEDEYCHGVYHSFPSPFIEVDKSLTGISSAMTKLHESLHAISDMYGLGFDEQAVRTLEMALTNWMRDNPRIVQDLMT